MKKAAQASRMADFCSALSELPWIEEKLESGAQFNAYDDGDNGDEHDEDCDMIVAIGPISNHRVICWIEGRAKAEMLAAALQYAACALAQEVAG